MTYPRRCRGRRLRVPDHARCGASRMIWDDVLHPIFQMNLPEGYLLQVLQEQFGPVIGASPMALLSVIGRNMIGRVQVAPAGATLDEPAQPIDVAALLQGDNSEEAFADLVRRHATSGVSGIVPKFLDTEAEALAGGGHTKATLFTRRHIIKGSSRLLPHVALNEHLCMEVVRQVMPAARTDVSTDGRALVVHRFDVDDAGQPHWGLEDFCVLLGLRPAAKYETTWERIAKAVRDHVRGANRQEVFTQMASLLLLTYALRNADCHAKNLALRYTNRRDVHLAPAFDMITTAAYPDYAKNPPRYRSWVARPGIPARRSRPSSLPPSACHRASRRPSSNGSAMRCRP
jgi:serine/threonine-protein kinase HipA